jgi:hypothetical protein
MFYLCYFYSFTFTCVQHDFHIKWCSCRLTATRRLSHMDKELLSLLEHLSISLVFSGVRNGRYLDFCEISSRSLFFLLSFFIWQLHCLQFTAFDYPLLSSKLFLTKLLPKCRVIVWPYVCYETCTKMSYDRRTMMFVKKTRTNVVWPYGLIFVTYKNVDIKFSAQEAFLEWLSSCSLKAKIFDSPII